MASDAKLVEIAEKYCKRCDEHGVVHLTGTYAKNDEVRHCQHQGMLDALEEAKLSFHLEHEPQQEWFVQEGCGDHGCLVEKPKGMGTNGSCRCFEHLSLGANRRYIERALRHVNGKLTAAQADVEKLKALLHEAAGAISWGYDRQTSLPDPGHNVLRKIRAAMAAQGEGTG